MNKQAEMAAAEDHHVMPTAPPSYDETMAVKQPAYNPQMTGIMPVQAGFAGHSGYAPVGQQPGPATTYIVHQQPPTVVIPIQLGPRPASITCPQCQKRVTTDIDSSCKTSAHLAAFILCLLGCYICCCIPYCMDSFRSVHHKCPNCGTFLGTYKH